MFDQAKLQQRVVDSTEVKDQLVRSFKTVSDLLSRDSKINLRFSGSTCVTVLIVGTKVFCANVGDSRACLIRSVQNHDFAVIPLNRDHKADEPDEEQRILKSGGRVQPYRD
jgi:serine/threonine protein phosphatase PrpC